MNKYLIGTIAFFLALGSVGGLLFGIKVLTDKPMLGVASRSVTYDSATQTFSLSTTTITGGLTVDGTNFNSLGGSKQLITPTGVNISSSNAETAIFATTTITANAIASGDGVRVYIPISQYRTEATPGVQLDISLKLNGTEVCRNDIDAGAGGQTDSPKGFIEAYIYQTGSAAQDCTMLFHTFQDGNILNGGSISYVQDYDTGSGTADATSAIELGITAKFNSGNVDNVFATNGAVITLIK